MTGQIFCAQAIVGDAELGFVHYAEVAFGGRIYAAEPDARAAHTSGSRPFGPMGLVSGHAGISLSRALAKVCLFYPWEGFAGAAGLK